MRKALAERAYSLSVFWLRRYGYLPRKGFRVSDARGGIEWISPSGNTGRIGFRVILDSTHADQGNQIILNYTWSEWSSKKVEPITLPVRLTTTRCNFGGKRYWFVCPLSRDSRLCGRRIGVIYDVGRWFGCRACANISYSAQRRGGRFRWPSVSLEKVKRAEMQIKRPYYAGKPTRKHLRFQRLSAKLRGGLAVVQRSALEKIERHDF